MIASCPAGRAHLRGPPGRETEIHFTILWGSSLPSGCARPFPTREQRSPHDRELPPYLYHGTRGPELWFHCETRPSSWRPLWVPDGYPDSLSGWRSNCELAIQVASRTADSGGCTFCCSDNGVYLTEGVGGAIPPEFISAVVILHTGEVITSPTAGTAPSGEAVEAGLRRARRGYMCATCSVVALICKCQLLVLLHCWHAQVVPGLFEWTTRTPKFSATDRPA